MLKKIAHYEIMSVFNWLHTMKSLEIVRACNMLIMNIFGNFGGKYQLLNFKWLQYEFSKNNSILMRLDKNRNYKYDLKKALASLV